MMKRWIMITALLLIGLGCLRAEVSLFLSDCVAERGDTVEIGLYISDATTVTAFQTDILFPTGAKMLDAQLSVGETGHSLMTKKLAEGKVRVGCWSPSNATFSSSFGRIATLTVLCPAGMLGGTYSITASAISVVYPNGGKKTLPSTSVMAWVSEQAKIDDRAQLFTEHPTAQAFYIQNTASSRWLTLSGATSKATIEDARDEADAQIFLEPAFDAGADCYYLRTAAGYYLNLALSASTVRIGITQAPSAAAAVRLVLTGERTYSIQHATGGQPMGTSSKAAGSSITMKGDATSTGWKFLPGEAMWTCEALAHMAAKASSCIGLTKGEADLALRMVIHQAVRAADEKAEAEELAMMAECLKRAVNDALSAQAQGDDTEVSTPWGIPENVPSGDYVVSVGDSDTGLHFLMWVDGQPVLTDVLSICNAPIQDIFFNPYTNRYALRLAGSDNEGEGTYLAYNASASSLSEAPRSEGEALRVWRVQTLSEAMKNFVDRSGSCGAKAKWRFDPDTRTLFITGSERTAYYTSAENTPWSVYRQLIRRVVLAGDFQNVGSYLLAGCTSLTCLVVTASKAPAYGTNAFEGVPEGLEIQTLNPDAYSGYLPGCQVRNIVLLKNAYTYNGQPQRPQVDCDFDYTVTATMQTLVGTYNATATLRLYIEGTSYTFTTPFTYTIEPAKLIATTRAYSRNYGSKNPNLIVTFEGLVGEDEIKDVVSESPMASCEADKLSPVGDYPITISGGALKNANYTLVCESSTLTVKAVRLTVRVQDATRHQGEPNPAFTCTFSGFVNGEDEAVITVYPVITTDADESSAPGLYDIVASGGVAPNYDLRYVTGILTITPSTEVEMLRGDEDVPDRIYDLQGRAVGTDSATLPSGLYIVRGKKIRIP